MAEPAPLSRAALPSLADAWSNALAPALRRQWARHRNLALGLAVAIMAAAAAGRLAKGFYRLLLDPSRTGAIDLFLFKRYLTPWFAGEPYYGQAIQSPYPPASFPLLWLLVGWLDKPAARWFWAATTVLALAWLIVLFVRESGATGRLERAFIALLPLAATGSSVAIGNGQLIFHLLPPLLAGLLLAARRREAWAQTLAVGLLTYALVKPTVSVPFFWILLILPGGWLLVALVGAAYAALTLLAVAFQPDGLVQVFRDYLAHMSYPVSHQGYANLNNWLHSLGLTEWMLPASLLVLLALGAWVYRNRRADVWLLLGVTAVVARLWSYHFVYDDVLILIPLVALFRLARRESLPHAWQTAAGLLLAVGWAFTLAPARSVNLPPPWPAVYEAGQTGVWLALLACLALAARAEQKPALEKIAA